MKNNDILSLFFLSPDVAKTFNGSQWQLLLQQSYATNLVARAYFFLKNNDLLIYVPEDIQWHFHSAYRVAKSHKNDVLNEIEQLKKALKLTNISPIYLKGAAYIIAEDSCMQGRLFSDVDIFVEKEKIESAEQVLRWQGWQSEELDEHDQKYYRQWMHEIPPMRNSKTNMTVDVHHNLLPLISKITLNSDDLLNNINNVQKVNILSRVDRILHSTIHLLLDGEFKHGYRDLHDIYLLINDGLQENQDFLNDLCQRAKQLNFSLLLYYCFSLLQVIFLMPINQDVFQKLKEQAKPSVFSTLIVKLLLNVINPSNKLNQPSSYRFSLFLLFLRSHWLKMPIHILVPHLLYKAFITPYLNRKKAQEMN